jgi:hypothetical protein
VSLMSLLSKTMMLKHSYAMQQNNPHVQVQKWFAAMTSIERKFLVNPFQKNKISVKSILRLDTGKQINSPVEATRIWVGKLLALHSM